MRPSFRSGRGFTIIELLIAVALVSLLAVLAVQSFSRARLTAYNTNLKANVREYRQAMELYNARYKNYFVFDRSLGADSCTASQRTSEDGYTLKGLGTGCAGFNGGSEGRMTRKAPLANHSPQSIAEVLVKEGVMSGVKTYPDVKATDSDDRDFILTLCDSTGKQAHDADSALNIAIYADIKEAAQQLPDDQAKVKHLCGAPDSGFGWNTKEDWPST